MLVKIDETNQEVYQSLAKEMYSSDAVCYPFNPDVVKRNVQRFIHHDDVDGFLIEWDGTFVGYILLAYMFSTEIGNYDVWLEEIYIKETMRGHGLGSKVIQSLKGRLNHKVGRIRLEVAHDNQGAISLYENLGFEKAPYEEMIFTFEETES